MSSSIHQPLLSQKKFVLSTIDETRTLDETNSKAIQKPLRTILLIFAFVLIIIGFAVFHHNNAGDKRSILQNLENDDGYSQEAIADLITDWPNLIGTYDFLTFSGYLEATNDRLIHYIFVEAEESPDDKPIFLWTNGGPGCSGLEGMFAENGPFWVYSDLQLRANEYSWNKEVNMLFVEQPYGVGFSVKTVGAAVVGDSESATDVDAALRSFMVKFPKYAENDLYISSESYGGHYMPMTAITILQNNDASDVYLNFKGFMVGNPYTDYYENLMGFVGALYGHGIIKSSLFDEWMSDCYGNTTALAGFHCEVLYIQAYLEGYDLDDYALDYSNCPMDELRMKNRGRKSRSYLNHYIAKKRVESVLHSYEKNEKELAKRKITKNKLKNAHERITTALTTKITLTNTSIAEAGDGEPWIACAEYLFERYLNLEEVQSALHVTSTSYALCNDQIFDSWPEKDWHNGMEKVYQTLVDDYDIKILIYSGDDDSVCGLQGTMYWINNMGWTIDSSNKWEKWILNDQLSGFYTRYLKSNGDTAIHFHTVRSAGHMVPQTQPERSLKLLQKYLYDLD